MGKNIFEKIGENLRKEKENKEKKEERYWKLPAMERLHYDSKVSSIKKENNWGFLSLTYLYFKGVVALTLLFLLFALLFGDTFFQLAKLVFLTLIPYVLLMIFVDTIGAFGSSVRETRQLKKLNKRFKLE